MCKVIERQRDFLNCQCWNIAIEPEVIKIEYVMNSVVKLLSSLSLLKYQNSIC
jgi:hypothetical protein